MLETVGYTRPVGEERICVRQTENLLEKYVSAMVQQNPELYLHLAVATDFMPNSCNKLIFVKNSPGMSPESFTST